MQCLSLSFDSPVYLNLISEGHTNTASVQNFEQQRTGNSFICYGLATTNDIDSYFIVWLCECLLYVCTCIVIQPLAAIDQ